jgi:protein-S-isoprenylcysteine O-methyltransferase Ste14
MRPMLKAMLALVAAGAVLFIVSASGQAGTYWESGPSWLGAVGWFGFLACLLLLMVSGLYLLVARIRHRGQPAPR